MNQAQIIQRIDALTAAAEARRPTGPSCVFSAMGGATIDLMTSEERAELHSLKLQLPTFAEEREAARARIAARIAARRNKA
jgi:hypothetical protein